MLINFFTERNIDYGNQIFTLPALGTHMHSQFSGDSEAPQEEMISSAIEKDLPGSALQIIFDIDYPEEPDIFLLDLPNYTSSVLAYQEKYAAKLPVRLGIEIGLQPHLVRCTQIFYRSIHLIFVIGSSHVVHGFDPYYAAFYEKRTEKAAYREYFESILENIESYHDFDVYGHLDYVVRYGPTSHENYDWREYQDVIDDILRKLVSHRKRHRAAPRRLQVRSWPPESTEEIIRRYRELGGEIITIGADAHKPEHVAFDFAKVPSILKDAGFEYFTVFKERNRSL